MIRVLLICLLLAACSPLHWHVADSANAITAMQYGAELNPLGYGVIPAKLAAEVGARKLAPEKCTQVLFGARTASTFGAGTIFNLVAPGAGVVVGAAATAAMWDRHQKTSINDCYEKVCYIGKHDDDLIKKSGVKMWLRPWSDNWVCVWGGDPALLESGGWRAI